MTSEIAVAATDFISAQTDSAVYRSTVDTAHSLLDADTCRILTTDPENDQLVLRASAPSAPIETIQSLPFSSRILTQAYARGNVCVIDDLTDVRSTSASPSQGADVDQYRSLLIVPIDDVGIFLAADQRPAHFTDDDIDIVEQLLSYAEVALDRIHSQARRNARGEHLEEIIATFSHDIRTPLQVARGYLEFAQETGDDEHFDRIVSAHTRMEELLDDMSRLAETGKRVDALQTVDLKHVAERAWDHVATRDATLEIVDTHEFEADKNRLSQLLENLFRNAVDHGPANVNIWVGTLASGFYVEDDGPGIPEEDRDGIFQWRPSSDDDHSGLGLRIVKTIVDAHGWKIRIAEGKAGGARFEVTGVT